MKVGSVVFTTSRGGVSTITLDSPSNRNALSTQMLAELQQHLELAISNSDTRVIVLTHSGTVFCAGMDLKESRKADQDNQAVHDFPRILETIWTSPKPVVVRLSGLARAGGIGIVAAADIVIAANSVTFAFSEVRIGLIPAVISIPVLKNVGRRSAHELFLTGETFDAQRAESIGLINRAVPSDELDAEIERVTGMLTLGGPNAMIGAKNLTRGEAEKSLSRELASLSTLSASFFSSAEGQEGIRSFAEKRPPWWAATASPARVGPRYTQKSTSGSSG